MTTGPDADVIIVGAGLGGLRCARVLGERGLHALVLEAHDVVGGRQRTEEVDGFLVDVGFQVVNPAYPALSRAVDLDRLDLHPFGAGVQVRRAHRRVVLAHPLREPQHLPATLASGYITPHALIGLLRWATPALLAPGAVKRARDATLDDGLTRAGLTGPLADDVLRTFLAGVLVETPGSTSENFARLLVRMFALGVPGLPAEGIRRLPQLIADGLTKAGGNVRTGVRVEAVHDATSGVRVETSSGALSARAAVVAVGAEDVTPLAGVTAPSTKGLVTWWFATDERPSDSRMLSIDGRHPRGPVVNALVVSNAVPTYAPPGQHLVQATCLADDGGAQASEAQVRRHVGEILGCATDGWRLVRRHDVPHALPAQPPPLQLAKPARVGDRLWVAGDHRDTASIQGALVSGERVAADLAATLR